MEDWLYYRVHWTWDSARENNWIRCCWLTRDNDSTWMSFRVLCSRTALIFILTWLHLGPSACASRPCLHNSTCQSVLNIDPLSAYRCHCRPGYTGRNCEVGKTVRHDSTSHLTTIVFPWLAIVTACERTPCLHGQCLKIDVYTEICICEDNWSGIDCSRALSSMYLQCKRVRRPHGCLHR